MSVGFYSELVFVHDFITYECALDAEVLLVLHRGSKVGIFDVDDHVLGSFVCIRYGAANVNFLVEDGY